MAMGMKQPLNMLENPIYPNIRKELPQFKSSGKHWTVGPEVILNHHDETQMYQNAILPVSRDFVTRQYGVSSHRSYVNKAFRPPLIRMEDTMSLSRQPRPATSGRINPSLSNAAGSNIFSTQNSTISNIQGYLTDGIKDAYVRPTAFCPIQQGPLDNSILPDLELKLNGNATKCPTISVAPINSYRQIDGETNISYMLDDKTPSHSYHSGVNNSVTLDGEINSDYNFSSNVPLTSAAAGYESGIYVDGNVNTEYEYETKLDFGDISVNPTSGRDDSSSVVEFNKEYAESHTESRLPYSYYVNPEMRVQSSNNRTELPYKKKKIERYGSYKLPNNTSSQFVPIDVSLKEVTKSSNKKYHL